MEKTELGGYCEFASRLIDHQIEKGPTDLLRVVDESAVHTFGWPIAPVLHREEFKPKPYEEGIKAIIDRGGRFDFWTLKKNGDFYILKSLFEDSRKKNCIFIDTRTIRTAEILYRTGQLYKSLAIEPLVEIECRIEYGGLKGRTLAVASPNRDLQERTCTGNIAVRSFTGPIRSFIEMSTLKNMVYQVVCSITEMCDYFTPERAVIDQMVEDYIVNEKVR